jgi:hypothetical protein
MQNLKELKDRLEKLPQLKGEMQFASCFGQYTEKVSQSGEKLRKVQQDMGYIAKVYPNAECEQEVLPYVKLSIREAKKLYKDINEDVKKVMSHATDKGIVQLGEYAKTAKTKCKDTWEREKMKIVTEWEKMANVVQILDPDKGEELKQVVDRIEGQKIPQDDEGVDQIKTDIEKLKSCIKDLEFDDPFVKFLKSTVEGGASLKVLSKENPHSDEIMKKLKERDLWDSFRIRFLE